MKYHHWWDFSLLVHPASCRSAPCRHGSTCVAMCMTLQAGWCLCPCEWRFPLEKEALCQGSRWAGAAAAGRPCMIITWAYCLQQCQNGHLALSRLCSGLLLSQLPPEVGCRKGSGRGVCPAFPVNGGNSRFFSDWRPV